MPDSKPSGDDEPPMPPSTYAGWIAGIIILAALAISIFGWPL